MYEILNVMYEMLNVSLSFTDVFLLLLATFGTIELIESELYGPFKVLKLVKAGFQFLAGDYCGYCLAFWVGASFAVLPNLLVASFAVVGFKFLVDYGLNAITQSED